MPFSMQPQGPFNIAEERRRSRLGRGFDGQAELERNCIVSQYSSIRSSVLPYHKSLFRVLSALKQGRTGIGNELASLMTILFVELLSTIDRKKQRLHFTFLSLLNCYRLNGSPLLGRRSLLKRKNFIIRKKITNWQLSEGKQLRTKARAYSGSIRIGQKEAFSAGTRIAN